MLEAFRLHAYLMATMEVITVKSPCIMDNNLSKVSDSAENYEKAAELPNKKSHRRKPSKKKRKWKPYSKLTWHEKMALEEKEKKRATRIREEMMDNGHPVAPYNTTQFIMAEYDTFESDTQPSHVCSDASNCGSEGNALLSNEEDVEDIENDNMQDYTVDSPQIVQEFISKDFSETYERVQEESLQTMTKEELMREHIELERTINELRDKVSCEKSRVERRNKTIQDLKDENKKLQVKLNSLTDTSSSSSSDEKTTIKNVDEVKT